MSTSSARRVLILAAVALLATICLSVQASQKLDVPVGSFSVVTGVGISQVAVANPAVADVQPISTTEVLVTGLTAGTTYLVLWDKKGRRQYDLSVTVPEQSAREFATRIGKAIGNSAVTAEAAGDKVILRGQVASADELRLYETTAKAMYPKVENLLTVRPGCSPAALAAIRETLKPWHIEANLMPDGKVALNGTVDRLSVIGDIQKTLDPWKKEADFVYNIAASGSERQDALKSLETALGPWNLRASALPDGRILVAGAVPDADTLARVEATIGRWPKEMGIISGVKIAASSIAKQVLIRARVVELDVTDMKDLGVDWSRIIFEQGSGGQQTFTAADQPFIIGQGHAGPFNIFGGPPIQQLDPIGARISALLQNNKAHVLSQPSLVTMSGTTANILIGGEIPVPVPQAGAAGSAVVTIEYKQFGISLNVTPTVGDDSEIAMMVKPEVSQLDYANAIILSGFVIPALKTRKAEATVHVASGTSIAIGGLVSRDDVKNVKAIPLLSKIPILGNFFKDVSNKKQSSELLIVLTPEIVGAAKECQIIDNSGWNPEDLQPAKVPPDRPPSDSCLPAMPKQ